MKQQFVDVVADVTRTMTSAHQAQAQEMKQQIVDVTVALTRTVTLAHQAEAQRMKEQVDRMTENFNSGALPLMRNISHMLTGVRQENQEIKMKFKALNHRDRHFFRTSAPERTDQQGTTTRHSAALEVQVVASKHWIYPMILKTIMDSWRADTWRCKRSSVMEVKKEAKKEAKKVPRRQQKEAEKAHMRMASRAK
ncbi:hypothetical protein BGZ58_009311 [Dissophora ornata]|nr:hypothetical protein BGZ58_009311 [Dissophora ornata]